MEPKGSPLPKDPHGPEMHEFINKLFKTLADKDQVIKTQAVELESLGSLIAFYREQFELKKCEKCENNKKTMESFLIS